MMLTCLGLLGEGTGRLDLLLPYEWVEERGLVAGDAWGSSRVVGANLDGAGSVWSPSCTGVSPMDRI